MKILVWLAVLALAALAAIFQLRNTPVVNGMLVRIGLMEIVFEVPFNRTLTDSRGRSIETEVIGFSKSAVACRRLTDSEKFVIEFAQLSEADRELFSGIDPQSAHLIDQIREDQVTQTEKMATLARVAGRHATWHRDIQVAKREAETANLPICLLFLHSDGDLSDQLDRFVVRSEEFRKWANTRVVLCLYYNDHYARTARPSLDSSTKDESRDLAKLYSVSRKKPTFIVLNPDATVRGKISNYKGEATSVVIGRLENVLGD